MECLSVRPADCGHYQADSRIYFLLLACLTPQHLGSLMFAEKLSFA